MGDGRSKNSIVPCAKKMKPMLSALELQLRQEIGDRLRS